jgi:hypothetical protein
MVNFYADITPLVRWAEIDVCLAGTRHTMVAVRELPAAVGG